MKNKILLLLALLCPVYGFSQVGVSVDGLTLDANGGGAQLGLTGAVSITRPNEAATGTTQFKLVKIVNDPPVAKILATTDTGTGVGICTSGCGTTGNAVIATIGTASCVFDNATTANDYFIASVTTAGDCHDAGNSLGAITTNIIFGQVNATNGSPGTNAVTLTTGDSNNPTAVIKSQKLAGNVGTVTSVSGSAPLGGTVTTTGNITCATCATGPGSSTAGDIATFTNTNGLALQDSGIQVTSAIPSSTISGGIIGGMVANQTTGFTVQPFGAVSAAFGAAAAYPLPDTMFIRNPCMYINGTLADGNYFQEVLVNSGYDVLEHNATGIPKLVVFPGSTAGGYCQSTGYFYGVQLDRIAFVGAPALGSAASSTGTESFSAETICLNPTTGVQASCQPLGGYVNNAPTASQTNYYALAGLSGGNGCTTTEQKCAIPVPFSYTLKYLTLVTSATQSATGTAAFAVRQNGSTPAGEPTITLATNAPTGTRSDLTHSFTGTGTGATPDWLDVQVVDGSGTQATVNAISTVLYPTAPATGLIVFPVGYNGALSASTQYYVPCWSWGVTNMSGTQGYAQCVMPRAGTLKNFSCMIHSAPANTAVATVEKNEVGQAETISITSAAVADTIISDSNGAHAFTFVKGDRIDLSFLTGSSTAGVYGMCSAEVD